MKHARTTIVAITTLMGAALACTSSKLPATPVAPTSNSPAAGSSGETLKISAPTPIAPANGITLNDTIPPTLTASGVTPTYDVTASGLQYDFELYDSANVKISTQVTSTPSYKPALANLDPNKRYTWRVRGALPSQNAYGPWSPLFSFTTPDNVAFLRGNELYDPLIDGKTVGNIIGPTVFIPGKGLQLQSFGSYIAYVLPQPLIEGEFSVIVSNVSQFTPGSKTKILAMAQGFDDIVTNDRRFTLEKRAGGEIAWRFITHDDQIETSGPQERPQLNYRDENVYLFQVTWRSNVLTIRIMEGPPGSTGQDREFYKASKSWRGRAYDPSPHVIYVGSPGGRSGEDSGTVPGIIVRQAWVSGSPRPAYANK